VAAPCKLTEARVLAVAELSRKGATRAAAAAAVGVNVVTLFRWLRAGKAEAKRRDNGQDPDEARTPHVELVRAVALAESELMAASLDIINAAAKSGTWTAAAWILERRWPESFGQNRGEIVRLLKKLTGEKGKGKE
jgi:transposase-like protein